MKKTRTNGTFSGSRVTVLDGQSSLCSGLICKINGQKDAAETSSTRAHRCVGDSQQSPSMFTTSNCHLASRQSLLGDKRTGADRTPSSWRDGVRQRERIDGIQGGREAHDTSSQDT